MPFFVFPKIINDFANIIIMWKSSDFDAWEYVEFYIPEILYIKDNIPITVLLANNIQSVIYVASIYFDSLLEKFCDFNFHNFSHFS